jgi:diadenosine tetraphosphatase ApaH/serine/threonine PP2A family protein phosphatase
VDKYPSFRLPRSSGTRPSRDNSTLSDKWDARALRDFEGPDGKRSFSDQGGGGRYIFSVTVDCLSPLQQTRRGACLSLCHLSRLSQSPARTTLQIREHVPRRRCPRSSRGITPPNKSPDLPAGRRFSHPLGTWGPLRHREIPKRKAFRSSHSSLCRRFGRRSIIGWSGTTLENGPLLSIVV